jgi:hypothetical protein
MSPYYRWISCFSPYCRTHFCLNISTNVYFFKIFILLFIIWVWNLYFFWITRCTSEYQYLLSTAHSSQPCSPLHGSLLTIVPIFRFKTPSVKSIQHLDLRSLCQKAIHLPRISTILFLAPISRHLPEPMLLLREQHFFALSSSPWTLGLVLMVLVFR